MSGENPPRIWASFPKPLRVQPELLQTLHLLLHDNYEAIVPFNTSLRVLRPAYSGAVTIPLPRSSGAMPASTSVRARATRLLITMLALGLTAPDDLSASHHRAATPATCGQAMLVPLMLCKPPPALADKMSTPGAATWAMMFENLAMLNFPPAPRPSAATETIPSDAAGKDAAILNGRRPPLSLSFPVAATTTAVSRNAACALTICMSASKKRRLDRYASSALDTAGSVGSPDSSICLTAPGKSKPSDIEITCAPSSSAH